MKRIILFLTSLPNQIYNSIILRYRTVIFATYPKIAGKIFIAGNGTIKLGQNVKINSSRGSNPIGGDNRTILFVGKDATISIGDHTGISNATIFCKKKIKIGAYVKIGGSVKIYDSDFHSLDHVERGKKETDVSKLAPVEIGDNCFIGGHSIILKGVTIGDKSIIGAGSVVTKSIPTGEIWAGNPAKFIKKIG